MKQQQHLFFIRDLCGNDGVAPFIGNVASQRQIHGS
jgi:hypothetical protein